MERIKNEPELSLVGQINENGSQIEVPPSEIVGLTDKSYLGSWDSIEAFVQAFIDENSLTDKLEPSWLRGYVRFDLSRLARDLVYGLIVMQDSQGGIHVFDPTA